MGKDKERGPARTLGDILVDWRDELIVIGISVGSLVIGSAVGYMVGHTDGFSEGMKEWANSDWDSFAAIMGKRFDDNLLDYKTSITQDLIEKLQEEQEEEAA